MKKLSYIFVIAFILCFGFKAFPEEITLSKKLIPLADFLKKAIEDLRGIDLEQARYFSRNAHIHPVASILLQDPLYSIVLFTKLQDSLTDEKYTQAFYIISKISSDVKRVDLIQNPAHRFFAENPKEENIFYYTGKITYPAALSIIYRFALCVSTTTSRIEHFLKANRKLLIRPPENLTYISDVIFKHRINQRDVELFLENLNTSFYILVHCTTEVLKNKHVLSNITTPTKLELFGINVEILDQRDDIVILSETPTVVINLGGNDLYIFRRWSSGGGDKIIYPSSTIIFDFNQGKDTYSFLDSRSLNLGFTYDEGGDDLYRCNIGCFGGAFFSADMLVDMGGNDTYEAVGISQGAGAVGTGVLIDAQGDDSYTAVALSQGFGGLGGGLLIDYKGNDKYTLKKGRDFPSYQDSNHNLSMGQGCGTGIRADFVEDLRSIPGGTGVLFDFDGDDLYSSEVFSQGCGYWYGIGALGDLHGNDVYEGYWYCQGSSAHFGVGVFYDVFGNDIYMCSFQAQGHGHDFGAGVFLDYGSGDSDTFSCEIRCLGSAHANGFSLFVNHGGSDVYKAKRAAFGDSLVDLYERKEHSLRQIMPTRGFFVDIGGESDRFFVEEKEISKEEITSKWYSNEEMKKYLEENYIIRKFYKF